MNDPGPDIPRIAYLYLKTVVTVQVEGVWTSAVDEARRRGASFHVITGWNQGDKRPSLEQNRAANNALLNDLVTAGCDPFPARGTDPDSDHAEESWGVTGLSDDAARQLGAEYGQVAVFRISRATQAVLACSGRWEVQREHS